MRPGQRSITVAMLVFCAAIGVAIAGVPTRHHEPAIRLAGVDAPTTTVPDAKPEVVPVAYQAPAPTTSSSTTSTTRPKTTSTAARRTTTTRRASATTTALAPATTIVHRWSPTEGATGLNSDGR